ncbi:uncharacterized protein At2g34460, chloroplastic isoform X3 [Amaranthus tricolor]|uniref:uncharacterized protein At2g34460, chloroplastic isoform X3 n=1 Tax=Amaranthus tricolor TaxID=29722 RepID=UPI002587C8FF|nr:uncharacterized protein At2g34460, chloroplastic isoform X3 [Amaranthus tricolor]
MAISFTKSWVSILNTLSISKRKPFIPSFPVYKTHSLSFSVRANKMEESEIKEGGGEGASTQKKIFVAGATGNTGKRIVEQLLEKGFSVKAGVRDIDKAKTIFSNNPSLQIIKADVTENAEKLAEAISDDSEALICATGFQRSWDPLAPWKAENYIRKSGINYTIIRPGGLRDDPPSGNIVMEPEDTLSGGSISRDQVAEVAVKALIHPEASYKVVEIIASSDAPKRSFEELFGAIKQR